MMLVIAAKPLQSLHFSHMSIQKGTKSFKACSISNWKAYEPPRIRSSPKYDAAICAECMCNPAYSRAGTNTFEAPSQSIDDYHKLRIHWWSAAYNSWVPVSHEHHLRQDRLRNDSQRRVILLNIQSLCNSALVTWFCCPFSYYFGIQKSSAVLGFGGALQRRESKKKKTQEDISTIWKLKANFSGVFLEQ